MSQIHTRQMGRLVASGTLDKLDATIEMLAHLRALHLVDYDGEDDDLSMGVPRDSAEQLSRDVNKLRNAAGLVAAKTNAVQSIVDVRSSLSGDLYSQVDTLVSTQDRLDEVESGLKALSDEQSMLSMVAPLKLEIDLLSGYENLTCFVGTVRDAKAVEVPNGGLMFTGIAGKQTVIGVFVLNDDAAAAQSSLESAGFSPTPIPEYDGSLVMRMGEIDAEKSELLAEQESLSASVESWVDSNADSLHSGLELLERDQELATAPVRIATTDHAFIVDGWVEMARADEVSDSLSSICTVVDIEPFKIEPGGGGHGHADHHHHQEMPPIAYQDRTASKPMELLTDAVGRPGYGRIDPTLFMFVTYPIFFGLMLGDMAYGLFTLGLGVIVMRRSGNNELMHLGGKFLVYIGIATIIFGYIYGEFAGFEYLPHGHCDVEGILGVAQCEAAYLPDGSHGHYHWKDPYFGDDKQSLPAWVSWMSAMYPNGGEVHWVMDGPFGLKLAYPFHRVTGVEDGGNLENLILLTIYLGVAHILIGLAVGFRDIWLYGNGHGDQGFVCALFEKGSWMLILIGGFLAAYAFLSVPAYQEKWVNPDQDYLDLMGTVMTVGVAKFAIGLGMLMWTLFRYHGVPFPINIGLAGIEAIGMLPTVLSYVRLFAVGVVGVKIAETGNNMLYGSLDFSSPLFPVILIGWLMVQLFAWGLGVFSPNIHAVRLHFVEWMRQFYDSSGEAFKPFGFKARRVEVE